MRARTRRLFAAAALIALTATLAAAHDMFLKPSRFFVPENSPLDLALINGTFTQSENAIARARLLDVSVVSPVGRARVDTSEWKAEGDTSFFSVRTGDAGTYVLGVSTKPNIIPLTGSEFNEYLKSDGIPDVLAARTRDGELNWGVKERYHKHVKALVQVGDARTEQFASALGYPAEIIPLDNPYALNPGATLRFRTVVNGEPAPNQYVQFGGRTANGGRIAMRAVRSDSGGIGRIRLTVAGTWYLKFIHMSRLAGDTAADYESTWASLTFAVR
jgi:uncharacterized GH25 family protein